MTNAPHPQARGSAFSFSFNAVESAYLAAFLRVGKAVCQDGFKVDLTFDIRVEARI